jgi:hypothetical protein
MGYPSFLESLGHGQAVLLTFAEDDMVTLGKMTAEAYSMGFYEKQKSVPYF